jgi:xylulose-5-phosphate/fructose-6-phosphate phosphoketolase
VTLQPREQHPHSLLDKEFDRLFTRETPVIFAYHGYPYMIHRLTYNRANHDNMHVRGFREKGTTTTPFDMVVLNQLDRYHLAIEAIQRVPGLAARGSDAKQMFESKLAEHHRYVREHGEDMPDVRDWAWPGQRATDRKP